MSSNQSNSSAATWAIRRNKNSIGSLETASRTDRMGAGENVKAGARSAWTWAFLVKVILAFVFMTGGIAAAIYFGLSVRKGGSANLGDSCGNGISVMAPISGNPNLTGLCCSASGFAGYTNDHCGAGCQPQYGRCDSMNVNKTLPSVIKTCVNSSHFALTFDDGPSSFTDSLLDYLKRVNVKATFFMNGNSWKPNYTLPMTNEATPRSRIFDRADVVRRAYREGHQICSHTWSHIDITKQNSYNLTYEVSRLNNQFATILGGIVPTCIRPPYDDWDEPSLKVLQGMGFGPVANGAIASFSVDTQDWNAAAYGGNASVQIANLKKFFVNVPTNGITLNHDVAPTTADFRVNGSLIPYGVKPFTQVMVESLRSVGGFDFVTLDKCLGYKVGSMYRPATPSDYVCGDATSYGGKSCIL